MLADKFVALKLVVNLANAGWEIKLIAFIDFKKIVLKSLYIEITVSLYIEITVSHNWATEPLMKKILSYYYDL